jgi:hypothetical protein
MRIRALRSNGRLIAIGAAVLLLPTVLGACTHTTNKVSRSGCDVIAAGHRLTPSMQEMRNSSQELSHGAEAPLGTLEWAVALLDVGVPTVSVFIDPGRDDLLLPMQRRIESRVGVRSTKVIDPDEAYANFRRLFAGNKKMLDNVLPEDLPSSVEVTFAVGTNTQPFVDWARDQDDVFEVRAGLWGLEGTASAAFLNDGDRRHWRRLADELDGVEGHPAWASLAATVLRDALEHGTAKASKDPKSAERNHRASTLLLAEVRRCADRH